MLFSSLVLLASSSFLSVLAAPIPLRRLQSRAEGGGWPKAAGDGNFGISGHFEKDWVKTTDGQAALVANYPAGGYAQHNPGGWTFQADGGQKARFEDATEVTFSYEVKFPEGFQFAKAGKLPGLFGSDAGVNAACSGGDHGENNCFSARLMWREGGKLEVYLYAPSTNTKFKPNKYGNDFFMSDGYKIKPGEWTSLTERVKLNTHGKSDGSIEVLVGGVSKLKLDGLILRVSETGRMRGAMIHTFFGGSSSPDFASPTRQEAHFRNFKFEF
jgi:hypothetical protein